MRGLENMLRFLCGRLGTEKRWKGFFDAEGETVLEHTFKQCIITQIMLAYEYLYKNPHCLNGFLMLQAAINHDLAEALVGDTMRYHKTPETELEEKEAYDFLIEHLIPQELQGFFFQPPDRSDFFGQGSKDFWHACEVVGYLLFAWEEMIRQTDGFKEVFVNSLEELEYYGRKFVSAYEVAKNFRYYYEEINEKKT